MKDFKIIVDWRSKFFGLPTQPPRRSVPSDEMEAVRELMRRQDERDARLAAEWREHVGELAACEAQARRAADERAVREDVAAFGAQTVLHLRRRVDPNFRLPADLMPAEEQEQ